MKKALVFGLLGAVASVITLSLAGALLWLLVPREQGLSLPAPLVSRNSDQGRRWEAAALRADLSALDVHFEAQLLNSWCGVASAVSVLGARGIITSQPGFFTEPVREVKPVWQTTLMGMTLVELDGMLASYGLATTRKHASSSSAEEFRSALMNNMDDPDNWLMINYDRRVLGQEGAGHISPVGAWLPSEDQVLILDVSTYKYPAHWVPVELLYRAMSGVDSDSELTRGWVEAR